MSDLCGREEAGECQVGGATRKGITLRTCLALSEESKDPKVAGAEKMRLQQLTGGVQHTPGSWSLCCSEPWQGRDWRVWDEKHRDAMWAVEGLEWASQCLGTRRWQQRLWEAPSLEAFWAWSLYHTLIDWTWAVLTVFTSLSPQKYAQIYQQNVTLALVFTSGKVSTGNCKDETISGYMWNATKTRQASRALAGAHGDQTAQGSAVHCKATDQMRSSRHKLM